MDIWSFCERFYGRKPVAALSLRLQQENDAVVAFIIWLCWHFAHKRFISMDVLEDAKKSIEDSQKYLILPLRKIRKKVRLSAAPDADKIALSILQAEVLLEKNQLEQLVSATNHRASTHASMVSIGLLDYLLDLDVKDAEQAVSFFYANAAACTE